MYFLYDDCQLFLYLGFICVIIKHRKTTFYAKQSSEILLSTNLFLTTYSSLKKYLHMHRYSF